MFKVGQKVVCTKTGWEYLFFNVKSHGPKRHEIVTITDVDFFKGKGYLYFEEYPGFKSFDGSHFRPLDYDFVEKVIAMVNERPVVIA